VFIAGAMCNVDGCELEPDVCQRINVSGPATVAAYLSRHGGTAVFFSTDHVFDGTKASYQESDPVHPLSVYARSKVDAEQAVRELLPTRHLILRTGWVYGPDPNRRNFILRLVDRTRNGQTVTVPSDQWGSPTLTDDLARATRVLLDRGMTGTFHATGPDYVDRATLAGMVCEIFGLDRHRIHPVPTEQLGQAAVRSRRVRLDCAKLHATHMGAFKSITEGLAFMADWNARTFEPMFRGRENRDHQ
jgi:dTDP-4-dehydrorhamnose reductase